MPDFQILEIIEGNLIITQNKALRTISGFRKLRRVEGNLVIEENDVAATVTGLKSLQKVLGYQKIWHVSSCIDDFQKLPLWNSFCNFHNYRELLNEVGRHCTTKRVERVIR